MSSNPTLDRWHTSCTVPGTWNAGVDGDTAHTGEGYHTWRKLLVWGDYSGGRNGRNISTRDLGGRDNCSAGVDRGGSVPAVQIMTGRLLAAIATEHGRYLLRGVREFNGYDGRTVLNRDAVLGWTQNYQPDASHKTHIHIGFFRDTCEDWAVISDALSVVNGTATLTTQTAPAVPLEEDDMPGTLYSAAGSDEVFYESGGKGVVIQSGGKGGASFNALVVAGAKVAEGLDMREYLLLRAAFCKIPWEATDVSKPTDYPVDLLKV